MTMTRVAKGRRIRAQEAWPRRAVRCQVQGNTYRTQPRASLSPPIYLLPASFGAGATLNTKVVPTVGSVVIVTTPVPACCMMWAIWWMGGPAISIWSIHNTAVPSAGSPLTRTWPTMPGPKRTTRIGSSPWRCAWLLRTGCPINPRAGICGGITGCLFPLPPSKTGWRLGGKRAARQMWTSYLDWSLADFSGYIAVDELYDGPFCVLSIVDNHTFKRLLYQVLDHDPEHTEITAFLRRFQMALRLRSLVLRGVTTDGSPLYPEPLQVVFGEVPHQICAFHILKEMTKAVLQAVAQVRKELAARKPPAKRGRPSTREAKRAVRRRERLQRKI